MKYIFTLAMAMLSVVTMAAVHNVKDYGAKGDGVTMDTKAVNAAIEAAVAGGGGVVYFPAGDYPCYSIHLKSNVTIYIESGAVITAAFPTAEEGYDAAEPNEDNPYQDFGHSHWQNSLMWAIGEHDITICGSGLIYGKGLTREESRLPGVGNKAISLKECRNVTIKDIRMNRCGHFAVLATGVENLTLHNMLVDTNRDGFDIDCCRNVRVSDCTVNSPWDDAIVLKASYGLRYFKDTENVTITGCVVSGYDQGSVLDATYQTDEPQAPDHGYNCGRIKIGTESSGGFKNIAITNCIFDHCRGLALETVDGGVMEDVVVNNITMRDIVNTPIFLRLGARQRSPEGTPVGAMRRITISNVSVSHSMSEYACLISGIPGHKIEDVNIENVNIIFEGGYTVEDCGQVIPENEKTYPEPWMFGRIPAKGFYMRHVDGINLRNIKLKYLKPDTRPLFAGYEVEHMHVNDIFVDNVRQETINF